MPERPGELLIESIAASRLSVALVEPFVIASARVDETRSVEVEARVVWRGRRATGLGEGACLPPVTREDWQDVLGSVRDAASALEGRRLQLDGGDLDSILADILADAPVARGAVETALLDAIARADETPLRAWLGGEPGQSTTALETDVTIPIADPTVMVKAARRWYDRGFRALKVKVGKDVDADARALEAMGGALPQVRLRVDANAGHSADDAIRLARATERLGLRIECWEQPCPAEDLDAMERVTREVREPVIADESVKTLDDVRTLVSRRYAGGVNLKVAKMGGVLRALAAGRAAREAGLKVMVGGMVETRLGMTAAAHLACALGGVDFVDLDTAWLLAHDPYRGGYLADGPRYVMPDAPGLGIERPASTGPGGR